MNDPQHRSNLRADIFPPKILFIDHTAEIGGAELSFIGRVFAETLFKYSGDKE